MSDATTELARGRVLAGITAITEGLASLASLKMSATLRDPELGDARPLGALTGNLWSTETHILDEPSLRIGILMGEDLVLRIASSMLMMPGADTMNEELRAAFDEAMNIAIGMWNPAMVEPQWRWDNSVAARRHRQIGAEAMIAELVRDDVGVAVAEVSVDGQAYSIVFFGLLPWVETVEPPPVEPPVEASAEPPKTEPPAAEEIGHETRLKIESVLKPVRTTAKPRPFIEQPPGRADKSQVQARPERPQPERSQVQARPERPQPKGPERSQVQARPERAQARAERARPERDTRESAEALEQSLEAAMVFVDRTGALKAWLLEQLNNPGFLFTKAGDPSVVEGNNQVIVLIEPGELNREIRAGRTIVMQRAVGVRG